MFILENLGSQEDTADHPSGIRALEFLYFSSKSLWENVCNEEKVWISHFFALE